MKVTSGAAVGKHMTSRERVAAALAHRETDRVPYDQSSRSSAIELEAYDELKQHLGVGTPTDCFLRSHAQLEPEVRERLGVDTEFVRHMPNSYWREEGKDSLYIDAWNVPWRRREGSLYYELDNCPLGGMEYRDILEMEWKPLVDEHIASSMRSRATRLYNETELALFSDQIGAGLFERAWYLRGLEQFLMDLLLEKEWVHRYMERILQHQIEGYDRVIDAVGEYTMGVLLTDDLATQQSLLISRDAYREMIYPYHKRLLEHLASRGMKVIFHSCGAVRPLVPDLLEAGVEILHPIQRSAAGMDPLELKKEFGKDLVLWGAGCDTALLQYGTTAEIADDVNSTLDTLGRDGGFVFTTTHCIQPGTPPENILAMADALQGSR